MEQKTRGRPKKSETKGDPMRIRLSEKDATMLRYLCNAEESSKSAVMRKALKVYYELMKNHYFS